MPKIVGETDGGEPIFEIRSVRLLLRGDASHFNRIAACSKCQRDVLGPRVLSPAALDHQLNPVICGGCVTGPPTAYATERTDVRTPPLPVVAPARAPGPLQNGHSSPTDIETVVLDGRPAELTSLIRTQGVELNTELDVGARNTQTELRGDLADAIEQLGLSEAELVAQNAAPGAAHLQAMEDQLRQLQLLVEAEVARAHAESAIREQGDLNILRIEQQLNERLKRLAELAERTSDADRQARLAIEQRLEETIERRTAGVEAQQCELRAAVEANVEQLRAVVALDAVAKDDSARLRSDVAQLLAGHETLAGAQQDLSGRLDRIAELMAQSAGPGPERSQAMDEQLRQLQLLVEAELVRAQAESAAREQGNRDFLRVEEQLTERLNRLAEQAERTRDADRQARLAIEQRLEETIERRTAGVEAQQAELRTAVEADLEHLRAVVRHDVGHAGADMAQVMLENEQLRRSHEALVQRLDSLAQHVQELHGSIEAGNAQNEDRGGEQAGLSRRLDEVVELVQRLQANLDSDKARADLDSATVAQINVELVRIEEHFNQRLDRLAERAARTDDLQADRLRSLEEQAQEALARIGEALESHRQVLQAGLRQELADVRASILAQETASDTRVQALEERLQQSDFEMSELGELHAVLDIGLGTLRSEIAEVRSAVTMVAGSHADIQHRLDEFDRLPQAALPEQGRGRRFGRKAESRAQLAVAIDAAELLGREHQQLKAQVARLEQEADAATARAASQASATSPLKSDIRLLWEQLAAQNDALGTLGRAVERLRRKVSVPAPAPTPATKPGRRAPTG